MDRLPDFSIKAMRCDRLPRSLGRPDIIVLGVLDRFPLPAPLGESRRVLRMHPDDSRS